MTGNGNGKQQVFEEIMLHKGPALRIEHTKIPVDQIHFDPNNPRLKYLKERFPDKTDSQLLFMHPDTAWLKKDIGEKGVLDAIYVKVVRTADATYYLATEGNRRTAVLQELAEEHPENPRYLMMPARILPENTTPEQEALLMASFHVAGKIKWDAHEKSGHIFHMVNILHIPELELANTLHMGVPMIKRSAESFALLDVFKKVNNGVYADEASGKWSFFNEMLKIKEFRQRNDKDGEFAEQFAIWVGEGRIPRAEDVRKLAEILKNTRARHLFENEPAKEAFDKATRTIDASRPGNQSKFFKQLEKFVALGKDATLTDIDLAGSNEVARDTLIEAHQILTTIMEKGSVRIPSSRSRAA